MDKVEKEMISNNMHDRAATFVVVCDNEPIGEGTLLCSCKCKAVKNRRQLCDGIETANLNALRIEKEI